MQHGHQFEFKRRDDIAYDAVPVSLKDVVIKPRDVSYTRLRSTFFRRGSPGIIIAVQSTQQVVEALAFARRHPQRGEHPRLCAHHGNAPGRLGHADPPRYPITLEEHLYALNSSRAVNRSAA